MPLIAMHKPTGKRIDITDHEDPKATLKPLDLICPVCSVQMIVKAGLIKAAHFAHKPGSDCIYADYASGESAEHLFLKQWMRDYLNKWYLPQFDVDLQIEYHIKEANRIADIVAIFPNGFMHVFEVQLAGITTESLQDRSYDYECAGCCVTWMLGNNAKTPANMTWVQKYQGELLLFDLEEINATKTIEINSDIKHQGEVDSHTPHTNGRTKHPFQEV